MTAVILVLLSILTGCSQASSAKAGHESEAASFVYVRIPGEVQPDKRYELFEGPIDTQLKERGLGEVSGGGTMQSAPDERGFRRILYAGVDIEAIDRDAVRSLLRDILPGLGAPVGTGIEFSSESGDRQDRLTPSGWALDEPYAEPTSGLR